MKGYRLFLVLFLSVLKLTSCTPRDPKTLDHIEEKETKFYLDVCTKKEGTTWNVVMARSAMDIIRQGAIELVEYYETLTQT